MQPSDSLPPLATAPVPPASGRPRCQRLFCALWPTTRALTNVSCVGDGSPALRKTGMCRGEARASQVTGPSSSCVPWSNTPPDTTPYSPSSCRESWWPSMKSSTLGIREGYRFRGRSPTARTFVCLRIACCVSTTGARLATGSGGLTLGRAGFAPAGRQTKFHEGIASSASITASATFGHSASPNNVTCWHIMALQ
jgi:hypothetical protein